MTETMQQLQFHSQPENIAVIERLIDEIRDGQSFQEECYGDVLIAMTEAVNNAIIHGNRLDENKLVFVEYELRASDLYFKITDQGPGFDFEHVPDPTAPENLEKPNGRGVFLMRQLSDECTFTDEGRVVEMLFRGVFAKP
ncbi:MAG: ATP-binding protein [Bacteroidetes bacterium]|jgi:serine/threonine-protein kinase RsbW|nr:ATP-binding protein [Bacteroidota bacterium]